MKIAIPRCMPRCKLCKKPLKNRASITKGVGPECATKFAAMLVAGGLTLESLGIPESISTDRVVARFLHLAEQALLAGSNRDVERFKLAAKEAAQRAERKALAEVAWREELQFEYGRFVQAAA